MYHMIHSAAGARTCLLVAGLLAVPFNRPVAAAPATVSGIIPKDWPTEHPAPVVIRLPADPNAMVTHAVLQLRVDGRSEPIRLMGQYEPADEIAATPARVWFPWKADHQDLGRRIEVTIGPSDKPEGSLIYRSQIDGPQLHVKTLDGQPVLSYWHGRPAPGQKYPLNDFIHPLVGLDGEVLTALSPDDHVHHRGVFWTWVRHTRDEQSLGSWWIPQNIHVEPGVLTHRDGVVFSRFAAEHWWVYQPKGSEKGERFVDEQVRCRVFEATSLGRAIDMEIILTALQDGIRFGGTTERNKGYGGLSIRYGKAADVEIIADGEKTTKDLNQMNALWADWSGRFTGPDGEPSERRSGVAMFVHPDHPDRPPDWITRSYGFLNVSYPGLQMLDLPNGQPLRLRYRLWVHRNGTEQGGVEAQYRAFAADWQWKQTTARRSE